ncbi:TraR/DksA family transcriptional regulator [Shimia haliotis]|uniref:Transcriptional regulator, TraR/DksA family n=1 Tax=Shimia haliotis TaxID=1280847 RepID=A0A1I4HCB3_9RHOB|nr:TraR/DksA family transcriptional regulator [Shimia haliotis]SFL39410.1 transcriptional regulator, TraR/DksA family [Shimia haliotis]
MTDVVAHKEALLSRLAELDERIHRIEHELEAPHTKDVEDQALEVEGEEVLEALEQQSQSEVVRIQAALKRIREGVYGDCLSCGDEIAEARLKLLPETTMCVTCAARVAG